MTPSERNRVPEICRMLYGSYDDTDAVCKQRIRTWIHRGTVPTRPAPECCELCGSEFEATPQVDFDRERNTFRGWLCRRCHTGLSHLGDNVSRLRRAIEYLTRRKV